MSEREDEAKIDTWGFTPKEAKRLTFRKNKPYKIVEDREGIEWLVDMVVDNGRFMNLIMMGTDGQVIKQITPINYDDYKIILGPKDLEKDNDDE